MNLKKGLCILLLPVIAVCYAGCAEDNTDITVSDSINEDLASEFSLPNSQPESFADPETLPDASSEAVTETNTNYSALDNTKQGWGMGKIYDDENRPTASLEFQEKYGHYDADFIKENTNSIYLTFDEGYEAGYTASILDTLKDKNVSAVFFVTYEYAEKNGDLIQRMVDEGHIVGNHTCSHPSMPEITTQACTEEITKLDTYIQTNFNFKMNLIRPPMGQFSEKTLAITQGLNYRSVFWSFAYEDWEQNNQPPESAALKKMVDKLHNGAIYLLHAVSKTNTNVLGAFIDQARAKGFEFAKYE